MIVDAHQHFWAVARGDYGWMETSDVAAIRRDFRPADYEPLRTICGIDRTILVQAAPTLNETHYLLGLADGVDWVAKVVGWIDFEDQGERAALEALAGHTKFAGVRPMIQDIPDDDWMFRADVQWGFQAIADLGLTFDALGFPRHLERFLRLMERYPNLPTVVDHCMKPQIRHGAFDAWANGIERIARETPALCKLSGLATEAAPGWSPEDIEPYADHVLSVFGPDRVMWGSDWPVLTLSGTFGSWFETAQSFVPEADRKAVFGENAARFYGIG